MEAEASDNPMVSVMLDVKRHQKRLHGAKQAVDVRAEMVNNVYPTMEQILVAVDERIARLEADVDELLGEGESRIEPDLAKDIVHVFGLGSQLAELLVASIATADDLTKKRYADAVALYSAEMNRVAALVEEATLVEAPEEGDGEDGEDEDDEDDEDDEEDTKGEA
jgi:hypothetical protein